MTVKKPARGFGKERKPESLQDKIEVIADSQDPDVMPYVDNLVAQMHQLKPLEEISLLTQEDAQQAITMIDDTLRQLNERLGVARSLKQLLETKQRG